MEQSLWWSPLRVCIFPLQLYSYHVSPRLVHQFSLFPVEPPLDLHSSLVFTCFVSQLFVPSFLLFTSVMPRLWGKSKRGSAWYQNRSRMAIRPQPTPAPLHNSSPSSPSSSDQASKSQSDLPPLSLPWVCRVKWFDLLGNSLGFTPSPLSNMTSSSQPTLVVPPNSPKNSTLEPPPMNPPPTLSPLEDTSVHWEKPPDQPHSYSDCTSCTKFQDGLAILQDLMFTVRKDVDDLRFRLEILDKKGTQILQMLPTLQGPRHSPDQASNAPMGSTMVLAPVLQMLAARNSVEVLASALQAPATDNVAHNKPSA